ncbi:hypothetical protein CVIRNUC_000541 [Coccomyxa viridis]|uniref:DNA-directed RNA polymerase subunit n=1 Tax=Coccomyxa viridis TaxID=1274662 RepID=A0AAV1HQP9_9CHLO|nr:hypothetical protein CVIRNUC_000541 [Coccomyxa viridis]
MTSGRDCMFCPTTGALLKVDDLTGEATCPLSGWSRSLEDMNGYKVVSRTNMEEYRRRYDLEPLVKEVKREDAMLEQQGRARATVQETCPQCGAKEMSFYTRQLRSADEGQTIFIECMACTYKRQENS